MDNLIQGLVELYGDLILFYDFSHFFPKYSDMTKYNNNQNHQTFTLTPEPDKGENAQLVQETRSRLHPDTIPVVSNLEKEEEND
jgi:hypothetical protein